MVFSRPTTVRIRPSTEKQSFIESTAWTLHSVILKRVEDVSTHGKENTRGTLNYTRLVRILLTMLGIMRTTI